MSVMSWYKEFGHTRRNLLSVHDVVNCTGEPVCRPVCAPQAWDAVEDALAVTVRMVAVPHVCVLVSTLLSVLQRQSWRGRHGGAQRRIGWELKICFVSVPLGSEPQRPHAE